MTGNRTDRWLIVSDTQEPFAAAQSISFCKSVQRFFDIPDENCCHAGDETDQFHGGLWDKDGDYEHTPRGELQAAKERMREWYAAFPLMKLAVSNHGSRWLKKAASIQMPSELLRTYREIYEAPEGWQWREEWIFDCASPWRLIHGQGYSGINAHRNAAMDAGISTVIGHIHSYAAVSMLKTMGRQKRIWGMNVGCLIDEEAYAFKYGKYSRVKGCLGIGVVLDSGKMPIWVPYD